MSRRYSSERSKRQAPWSSWKNDSGSKRGRFDEDTYDPQIKPKSDASSSRTMLTFRRFLDTLDDSLSDEEAVAKYNDYKLDFRKQEYSKFFEEHKEEEWFRNKYHPEASTESLDQQRNFLKKRLDVYKELVEQNAFDKDLSFEIENCENLIRFMDSVVINLEGGTKEDVDLMMSEPIVDESIEEVQKKKVQPSTNGNGDTDQAENGSAQANGTSVKMEVDKDSEAIESLLKRVPYKTNSIFFRNVSPNVKLEDLENECKNYPGFLRIGLSEPLNDQNFSRRLWVSFRRDVKIREIFWNIKDAKFVEGDAQPSVNRDLRRRVRTVNGIAHHRPIVQNDIRQAARLIALYDWKRKLFVEGDQEGENVKDLDALVKRNKNPILEGVFEHFVEECDAEEEELLKRAQQDGEELKFPLEVDTDLLKYLDKLLVYLRVVHSIDYYNHVQYDHEDSMPNRMGMVHVRDFNLTGEEYGKSSTGVPLVSKKAVDLFISNNDERLKATILKYEAVSEDDLKRLGKKDPDQVVEEFIQANCVELAQEKWLCPLSGKKFKGPEFIRKHLFSKHEQKIDETKHEAVFFNNYIADPDRPHNPEPKAPVAPIQTPTTHDDSRRVNDDRQNSSGGGYRNWNDRPRFGGNGQRYGSGNSNGRSNDYGNRGNRTSEEFGTRRLQSYRDLDAPSENSII